jgi:hypothetical protein
MSISAVHLPIDEKCTGCDRVQTDNGASMCSAYPVPSVHWRLGNCSLATHIKVESKDNSKVRVGQQKQKKK